LQVEGEDRTNSIGKGRTGNGIRYILLGRGERDKIQRGETVAGKGRERNGCTWA